MLDGLLTNLHVSFIHFPIVGSIFTFIFTIIAYILFIIDSLIEKQKHQLRIRTFEFLSFYSLIFTVISIPIVAMLGIFDAGSLDKSLGIVAIAIKIQFSILAFFILIVPILFRFYTNSLHKEMLFEKYLTRPLFYTIPIAIGTFLILIIAGEGGIYVFGHSLFDNFGLGFLIPKELDMTKYYCCFTSFGIDGYTSSFSYVFAFLLLFLFLLIFPYLNKKTINLAFINDIINKKQKNS
jgi:hypothetical protein